MDFMATPVIRLYVDDSWNPHVRRMGCGAVLRDDSNNWKSATSVSFDHGTAFLAEITDVELGMQHSHDLGYKNIVCASDCNRLVTFLSSGSDTNTFWDRESIRRVLALMTTFQSCYVVHIARERNNTADTLAREAARLGSPVQTWSTPPSFVAAAMFLDDST
ncbi:uncharacterized protein LOC130719709 [Lotus japonicus]|uniref:uncharacterized protein LOC130719709 n=1 Tax=Lotus japonicus TaxID=34305 RepID=UPI002583E4FB|nr:uncharacterized protein LOC130719709 [Lotus japonicus]